MNYYALSILESRLQQEPRQILALIGYLSSGVVEDQKSDRTLQL